MIFFGLFNKVDINEGVKNFEGTSGAILLDVRTAEEYREGHIAKSINIPLQNIRKIEGMSLNKNTPIFVHCLSGARSSQATASLKGMGFTKVTNIGGISSYSGRIER